jgi:hypothetical protein
VAVSQSIKIIICESHANFFYDLISGRGGGGGRGEVDFSFLSIPYKILVSSAFPFLTSLKIVEI